MMNKPISNVSDLGSIKTQYNEIEKQFKYQILVCAGAGCISSNCGEVQTALSESLERHGLSADVRVLVTGCMGTCAAGPVMLVYPGGIFYTEMTAEKVETVVAQHLIEGKIVENYTFFDNTVNAYVPKIEDISFFRDQVRIVLRNCGHMEFSSLDAYIARDGYFAAAKALSSMSQEQVVEEIKKSGLRGRGGAGFPTGIKWQAGMNAPKGQKYIVCNADEGDPGAFMDRSVLEGDPHSVIEGMMIGGFAIGADKGFIYVRAEYPLAVERLTNAIDQAREAGLLGEDIMGSGFNFDIEIRIGAGAFVCGEETALLASIEGQRGEPRQKPPFPFEEGLYSQPTIINNVETLANVSPIILKGAEWYGQYGTEKSRGTKVFALAGDIRNTGIIEVPMGYRLGDIIYKIGGGIKDGRNFKAVQSGGPSGGCLTTAHLNASVDYESLAQLGAIMGSGGLIVMDEDTCMVDTARYFLDFIKDESCGKCAPCRIGTKRMLEILEKITSGNGEEGDIEMLEELALTIKDTAMCGLGQTSSNPVLSTIKYFKDEYETHIYDKYCEAGTCSNLYASPCQNACPASVNVPGYMALVSMGRLDDAYELICQENPFPAVCGRICTHPCEAHCRRGTVDEPMSIFSIKRFIGDHALRDEFNLPNVSRLPSNGKKVAVIGSGPSGLACAYYLARLGYHVDVYEADSVAGGVLYWGIPEYRLPKALLAKEIEAMKSAGFHIHLNTRIGVDVDFDELKRNNDAVYMAIGTQKSKLLSLPGEEMKQVESGLGFLRRVGFKQDMSVPERLVVVGGGSTAMDVARTAIRLGSKEVTIVYRRTLEGMPASEDEIVEAIEEGVRFEMLTAPLEILSEGDKVTGILCERTQFSDYGKDGRLRTVSVPDSKFVIACDGVVTAINQEVDEAFANLTDTTVTTSGSVSTNKFTSQTSREGVFAGGDVSAWGKKTVIQAIADGKRAASSIDKYLGGTGVLFKGREIDLPIIIDDEVTEHPRFPVSKLKTEQRIDNFDEVNCGFHKLDAMAESLRCLHCERR